MEQFLDLHFIFRIDQYFSRLIFLEHRVLKYFLGLPEEMGE
jgi:hypothetical protein